MNMRKVKNLSLLKTKSQGVGYVNKEEQNGW